MSADGQQSVHDSSEDNVRRGEDVRAISFRLGRVSNCVDFLCASSLPLPCPPPSGECNPAPVSVTEYISDLESFLDS